MSSPKLKASRRNFLHLWLVSKNIKCTQNNNSRSEIFETFSYLHKCMATPKSNLTYKFNSLFVLKVLLDSSDYVLVNWIEIFFLPHIVNIAKYYLSNNGEGKNYFFSLGYTAQDDVGI